MAPISHLNFTTLIWRYNPQRIHARLMPLHARLTPLHARLMQLHARLTHRSFKGLCECRRLVHTTHAIS
eukprot:6201184-Pleurochrysis_carterae.AAC.3